MYIKKVPAQPVKFIRLAAGSVNEPLAAPSPDWPQRWQTLIPDIYADNN